MSALMPTNNRKNRLVAYFERRPWVLALIVLAGLLADVGLMLEIRRLQGPPQPHLLHAPHR